MWLVVAVIFTNGIPDPEAEMRSAATFATEAACVAYLESDAGAASTKQLQTALGDEFKIVFSCKEATK